MKIHLFLGVFSRSYCSSCFRTIIQNKQLKYPKPVLDVEELKSNLECIKDEIRLRKQQKISEELENLSNVPISDESLQSLMLKLPNRIHPAVKNISGDFEVLRHVGYKKEYPFEPISGTQLLQTKDLLRMTGLNFTCGDRSYYFNGDAVKLEQALINYTVEKLISKNFSLLSVPDILCKEAIEYCGMPTAGERTQVYKLDPDIYGPGWCLSGTSEMAIATYLMNRDFEKKCLPKLYTAVSRCFRAEVSDISSEKGIYRVHQFNKVEMFGVCLPHQSKRVLEHFLSIQEELFSSYGLHYRVLDMAAHELGNQAYRKFDVEAWMPGSNRFGELSSCSDCTDYQSRRLNIRSGETFLHTVNGTACATPRTINAICETFQMKREQVSIPEVLQQYTGFKILGLKRGPSFHKVRNMRGKFFENLSHVYKVK